jgi:hypothetical protein
MNPLHHMRKDLLQHRPVIVVWGLLLAADAVMSCSSLLAPSLAQFAGMLLIALITGLSISLGWSDSPTIGDHFLATRPVAPRSIWAGKALTLTLVIWLPVILQSAVVSGWLGLGGGHFLSLSIERSLLLVPILIISLCLGALEPRQLGLVAGFGPILGYVGAGAGMGVAARLGGVEPNSTSLLYVLWGMAVTMAGMLYFQIGRPRSLKRNLGLYALGVLLVFSLQLFGPHDLVRVRAIEASVPDLKVSLASMPTMGAINEKITFGIVPKVEGLPEGWMTIPIATGGRFGEARFEPTEKDANRMRRHLFSRGSSGDEQRTLAALCGVDMLFTGMNMAPASAQTTWPREVRGKHGDLEVDLDLFFLEFVPISEPTTVQVGRYDGQEWNLWVKLRTPQFRFSRDAETKAQRMWRLARSFVFVLVDEANSRAVLCDVRSSGVSRGGWSGFPEANLSLSAEPPEGLWLAKSLADVELKVFRRVQRGMAKATLKQPDFALDSIRHYDFHRDRVEAKEHDRLLAAVPEDDTEALLELIARTGHRFSLWEPAPQRLRAIGERDFGELLRIWQRYSNEGQRVLGMVVDDLLDDSHKAQVLAAIPQHPDLAYLAVSRGWEDEIREPLLAAITGSASVTLRMHQALLLLDDPSVYPTMLASFAKSPNLHAYDMLERVPALRPELDRLARAHWQQARRVIARDDIFDREPFQLGLRAGDPDALALMKECLQNPESRKQFGRDLVKAMQPVMVLPRQEQKALDVLAKSELRFHPDRRIYLAHTEVPK